MSTRTRLPVGSLDVNRLTEAIRSEVFLEWLRLIAGGVGSDQWDGGRLAPGIAGDIAHDIAREYEAGMTARTCARCGKRLGAQLVHGGLCCECSEAVEREVHHGDEPSVAVVHEGQHVPFPWCWCVPAIGDEDPVTGDRVYVHRVPAS